MLQPKHCRAASEYVGAIQGLVSSWKPVGPLKVHQDSLPYQPVPNLSQTLQRWFDTTKPVLTGEEVARAKKVIQ